MKPGEEAPESPSEMDREQQAEGARSAAYNHFDPYSIYSDDEEVWYSEDQLFEVSRARERQRGRARERESAETHLSAGWREDAQK